MSAIAVVVIGMIILIGGVTWIEFQAAPRERRVRNAAQAAAITTGIFCVLLVLAVADEGFAGPPNLP